MELTDKEKSLLNRIAKQKNLFLAFSIINVVVAVFLCIYYGLVIRNFDGIRFVLIILILLSGRSHLRQYRSALLLQKLKIRFERKDDRYETDAT
jgi:formate-dependent nitrite reductase membrane component NrfD